ncbi:MAG: cytochrome bo3 ubiquinol oxidase subunit 2 [Candidatus Westeberhardia cardiocondylae]|nr:cytochrome bo3 ubiquinol oxidase subunit 2 [Candidatus Westeberhardia cardiocondylae]
MKIKKIKIFILSIISILLSGCSNNIVLMNPKGNIGEEEKSLILITILVMLMIIIPVIFMKFIFCIKYRESNKISNYQPNWNKSNKIELTIWIIPIFVILFLSILTWISTHKLDPNKPIESEKKPIIIQVVSLDWKWLFIYPKYNIATINEIYFPKNIPIKFQITSNSVMNSFFIPQLGSQIYAMNGMNSTLYLISNKPGKYHGISSNFSGEGFSGMKFYVTVTKNKIEFENWIKNIKNSPNILNTENYKKLEQPTINDIPKYFSHVKLNLFHEILNKYNKQCNI